ncbi:zinc-binding alcohol dehydrogenase family protein [Alicyclobacillus sp. SO9]|uniref:zinc-binding alcohol dehydrogenase family protein n=1 Tax=Alicyclobacillus sp. SO9 TaxID=2665646 RepID=UPI0018E8D0DE|nr:zinc-binding alcohol dehydrogenase family protein [Alicyclobacillus sp. SO9]QQE78340.1 zinc-binding alcohol dehydrogenase family protein [Alicyclobacillus sp. SO9]
MRALAEGRHYAGNTEWPLVPGIDCVARTSENSLVFTGSVHSPYGTFAERMTVPKRFRFPLPTGSDPLQIAGGLNPGLASWIPLLSRCSEIGSLGTVIVLGVTGTAGMLAVQNARLLGAQCIIGIGRNMNRVGRLSAEGMKPVVLEGEVDMDSKVIRNALEGMHPTLVLDFLWGQPAAALLHALEKKGLEEDEGDISYVQIGSAAHSSTTVSAELLRSRRIRISGSGAGAAPIPKLFAELPVYIQMIADKRIRVPVRTFPLSQIHEAWLASRSGGPRVIVVPDNVHS